MARCRHCNGTGEAPETIKLECIGCQKSVTVTYSDTKELIDKCEEVFCADCKKGTVHDQ